MKSVTLEEAQKHLTELVRSLPQGGEVMILDSNQPVARLSSADQRTSLRDIRPQSVGRALRPYPALEEDLLDEMLGSGQ